MKLKYFTLDEFNCQVTGDNRMEQEFLEKLDRLRGGCGNYICKHKLTRPPGSTSEAGSQAARVVKR